jgi:hypothetical protein
MSTMIIAGGVREDDSSRLTYKQVADGNYLQNSLLPESFTPPGRGGQHRADTPCLPLPHLTAYDHQTLNAIQGANYMVMR